ncbi:hypothetical protein MF271_05025 [Deinococcus sp. KNUC1210]|uniref:hypothetical protein n=1 Tax=Deinococcus sp. KNUC1210 TaxID=2917691 RepID=UPI001EF098F1|nr:hypothetical protein [Deinococcus sp. KNUC1210]ULH15998.1 hypothetical protein MF271_05025 [Deinococcus sp. KNUC1210]
MSHTRRHARQLQSKHQQLNDWEAQFRAQLDLDACADEQARWRLLAQVQRDLYGFVSVPEPFYLYQLGLHREPFDTRHPRGDLPPVIRRNRR